jgi:hypothetical protein
MKLSTATDILGLAGVALIGAGLYVWHPFALVVFAGVVCLAIARVLVTAESARQLAGAKAAAATASQEEL